MRRYLIVDDNVAFADNVAEIVRDVGAEAVVVAEAAKAVEAARSTRFDALVTDMRMMEMNGARLVHEIRAVDRGLPAIVVSAYSGEDDLVAARDEGLLAVLPKPAPIPRLLELLRRARRNGLVAVVEEDSMLADTVAEALRDRGFSAVTARSVTERGRLGGAKPFAALVDIRVAGGPDGEALRAMLREHPRLPVLAMTRFGKAHLAAESIHIFEEPFSMEKIMHVLEELHEVMQ
jgi:two-component system, response regulator PdtaR